MAEVRQQHHADSDTDETERQLEDAIRVAEPGNDTIFEARDDGGDDNSDLRPRHPQ